MAQVPSSFIDRTLVSTDPTAFHGHQQIIGLSNGNILVVFSDNSDVGPGLGRDITGVIYDAEGQIVRAAFQVNTSYHADDERSPSIAATNDGGFIIVFEDVDAGGTALRAERHNAMGDQIDQVTVAFDPGAAELSRPVVAVDQSDNSFFVTYQVDDGNEETIHGRKFDANMDFIGDEVVVRDDADPTNSLPDGDPRGQDTAALTNGTFVTVYQEQDPDGDEPDWGIEFRISNADGTSGIVENVTTASNGIREADAKVAALADGGFVVVWVESEGEGADVNNNIKFRLYDADGSERGAVVSVIDTLNNYVGADVIGLEDGTFFVAFQNETFQRIEGRLFDGISGAEVGHQVAIETTDDPQQLNLGTTSDGRILVTYQTSSAAGNVHYEILDPRDAFITADPGDGQVTARLDGSTIVGSNLSERLLGQDGNDIFQYVDPVTSIANIDEIDGGGGSNTFAITTLADKRIVDLEAGVFALGNIDTTDATRATLANIQHVQIAGAQDVRGDGEANLIFASGAFSNVLHGMGGDDTIFAGGGDDMLDGGAGADSLQGAGGVDTVTYASAGSGIEARLSTGMGSGGDAEGDVYSLIENVIGSAFDDVIVGDDATGNILQGGDGADTLLGRGGSDMLLGGAGDDLLDGGASADAMNGGEGNDTVSYHGASTQVEVRLTTGVGSLGHANFDSYAEIENVIGSAFGDVIVGSNLVNNRLDGGAGNDTMIGNSGNDILTGGLGKDMMLGGADNDAFVFVSAADSAVGANRDTIWDFEDLGENDSIVLTGFAGVLDYIGQAAFSAANQVRAVQSGSDVLVQINTTGAAGAESEILLANTALAQIDASDFFL